MKKLSVILSLSLLAFGACSHDSAVRPGQEGDVIFNISEGTGVPSPAPVGDGSVSPAVAQLQQQLAAAQADLAAKQRDLDALTAQLQVALADNPKNEDIDAIKRGLEAARNEAIEAQIEAERLRNELAALQARQNELLADKPAPEDRPQSTFVQELDSAYNQLNVAIDRKKAALQVLIDQKNTICAAGPGFDQLKCDGITARVDQETQALLTFSQQNLTGFVDACNSKIAEVDQALAALPAGDPQRQALEQEKAQIAMMRDAYAAELAAIH